MPDCQDRHRKTLTTSEITGFEASNSHLYPVMKRNEDAHSHVVRRRNDYSLKAADGAQLTAMIEGMVLLKCNASASLLGRCF